MPNKRSAIAAFLDIPEPDGMIITVMGQGKESLPSTMRLGARFWSTLSIIILDILAGSQKSVKSGNIRECQGWSESCTSPGIRGGSAPTAKIVEWKAISNQISVYHRSKTPMIECEAGASETEEEEVRAESLRVPMC